MKTRRFPRIGAVGNPISRSFADRRTDALAVTALAVIWVAMIRLAGTTGDFPINDDWMFGRAVQTLLTRGRFEIASFSAPNVGPLVLWGALFCLPSGFSFDALRSSTQVLGLIGGIATYVLFVDLWKHRGVALIAATALLVNPIYFMLSNTFMTDVPFVAVSLVATVVIGRGIERERSWLVWSGVSMALTAVLIRQFAIVVLLGYLCARIAKDGLGPKKTAIACVPLGLGLGLHFAFNRWLIESGRKPYESGVPDISLLSLFDLSTSTWLHLFVLVMYVGLFTLPLTAVCLVPIRRRWFVAHGSPRLYAIAAATAAITLLVTVRHEAMPLGMNIVNYFGIGPLTFPDLMKGEHAVPTIGALVPMWKLVTILSIVGAACWVVSFARIVRDVAIERRRGSTTEWKSIWIAAIAVGYLLLILMVATRHPLYDRYFVLLFVLGACAVPSIARPGFQSISNAGLVLAVSILCGSAAFTVAGVHDHFAANRLRWDALDELTHRMAIDPSRIDGGMEFNGWELYDPLYEAREGKNWWWVADDEYLVALGPVKGYAEIRRRTMRSWLSRGDTAVLTLHRVDRSTNSGWAPS